MAGLDPAIHDLFAAPRTWMPGSSPGMTNFNRRHNHPTSSRGAHLAMHPHRKVKPRRMGHRRARSPSFEARKSAHLKMTSLGVGAAPPQIHIAPASHSL
ncbi:hypothetical protein WN72_40845 [Bradyrhizobium arachidis]|uniref:Uncharacterized protein n=1 Tax=Bradyrhizobium arachidis TaxID=858423 RepID=A0AAE7TKB2_9BRAD|nr:hypothetical protein WN72_40845 [Bradyrhizobium arachidis]